MKRVDFSSYSDVGGRGNNEDACLAIESEGAYLFAVADGLGGVEAGEVASGIVISTLRQIFLSDARRFDLVDSLRIANELILDCQENQSKKMKTTIAAVYLQDGIISCAHVGDSRIYLFRNDRIVYQSTDHSVSQMAVYAGEITAPEIRRHVDRNKLTRALGVESELKIELKEFLADDVTALLLCSDGFWEYVYEEEMSALLSAATTPDQWIEEMRKLLSLRVNGNNDNNTAVAAVL